MLEVTFKVSLILQVQTGCDNGYFLVVIYFIMVIRILKYMDDVQTRIYAGTVAGTIDMMYKYLQTYYIASTKGKNTVLLQNGITNTYP
jgi:hypothetical protein